MSSITKIIKQDELLAQLNSAESSRSYVLRVLLGDYRGACAVADTKKNELDTIRSLLLRGDLEEMEQRLENSQDAEYLFERARKFCFEGNFSGVYELATQIIANESVSKLTLMTSYQLRALSLFEQKRYSEALQDIEKILDFESLFPYCEASLFARQTSVRCQLMLGLVAKAEQEIQVIRNRIRTNWYSVNMRMQMMTYLRLICFYKRHLGQDVAAEALAGLWIARKSGAKIYEGLFVLELGYCGDSQITSSFQKELEFFLQEFKLIKYYQSRMISLDGMRTAEMNFHFFNEEPKNILFFNMNAILTQEYLDLKNVEIGSSQKTILKMLKSGPTSKERIYKNIWNGDYHPLENDATVRKTLNRLKNSLGMELLTKEGQVHLIRTLLVD